MHSRPVQLSEVIYNAANQCFEALATVHGNDHTRKYACAINAPISMSFEDAAEGLTRQALRRHEGRVGVYSEISVPTPQQRAGRPGFDPKRWLENLMHLPGRRAA